MDNNKSNKIIYTLLAVLLYIGVSVGIGLLVTLLIWKTEAGANIIYWVLKGVICAFILLYALLMVFGKKDAGIGAIQLMFTLIISGLPIICRALYIIPVAGKYISIVLAVLAMALYFITMIGLGFYATDVANNSSNSNRQ